MKASSADNSVINHIEKFRNKSVMQESQSGLSKKRNHPLVKVRCQISEFVTCIFLIFPLLLDSFKDLQLKQLFILFIVSQSIELQ